MMMTRSAVVVLEENLSQLADSLPAFSMHVIQPKKGMPDKEIADTLLVNHIFITNNTKDFLNYAPGLSIGVIGLEGIKFIDTDPTINNQTVKLIFQVIIQYKIWSKRNGFFLELRDDGKHQFQDF